MIDVHLISHTHWDREWYLTREQFRLRLVDLVDRVIEMLHGDSGYACFHLDGQTIVLEDYLEIRPERADEIRALVRSGRLLVGPWYVMPDEFLVSGESLVRNLALGHRIARSFGESMPVGYLPDLIGHVGQMPQILRQFGLDNAILWRGFDGPQAEYWWEAPDGSRVLMMHLPPEGYCNAMRIALVPDQMIQRTEAAIAREASRSQFGVALLMNGVDHIEPQDAIPALVSALRERSHVIRQSTLPAYVDAVRSTAAGDGVSLDVVRGELRGGEQYAPLLPGVLSARTYLKQANARVQTALERWAEPLSTWAWMLGERYPAAALQYAWKVLLQNHPHDSICGCSIDEVHDENMSRFARAAQVADDLIDRASTAIARRVAPAPPGHVRVLFFNTAGHQRTAVVEGTVDLPFASAEPQRHVDADALDAPVVFHPEGSTLSGAGTPDGASVPLQVLEERDVISWIRSKYETPWALHARRIRFAAVVDLPACGYAALDLRVGSEPSDRTPGPVTAGPRSLENDLLRITVDEDGTATIVDKRTGKSYPGCGALIDEGDVGDEYNYSPPATDLLVSSADLRNLTVERVHDGPIRARLRVAGTLPLPAAADRNRARRTAEVIDTPVAMEITLDAGAARVEWNVRVQNSARDHRLRIVFPSGLTQVNEAVSDTAFGLIARPTTRDLPAEIRTEVPVTSAPMQSFVAAARAGGAAVYARGLNEYEVLTGPSARIAVTLLRCVGDLSRDDLATRPHGHAGPGLATPGAQCPGTHTFSVAFEPLDRTPSAADLCASAASFVAPALMVQGQTGVQSGSGPVQGQAGVQSGSGPVQGQAGVQLGSGPVQGQAGVQLGSGPDPGRRELLSITASPGAAVLSALKKTDERDSVTVRLFNPSAEALDVRIGMAGGIAAAHLLNLLEERQEPLPVTSGAARIAISGFGVRTMELVSARRPLLPAPG